MRGTQVSLKNTPVSLKSTPLSLNSTQVSLNSSLVSLTVSIYVGGCSCLASLACFVLPRMPPTSGSHGSHIWLAHWPHSKQLPFECLCETRAHCIVLLTLYCFTNYDKVKDHLLCIRSLNWHISGIMRK